MKWQSINWQNQHIIKYNNIWLKDEVVYPHLIHQARIIFADPPLKLFPAKQSVFKNRSIRLKNNLSSVCYFRIINFTCNRMLWNSADIILFVDFTVSPDSYCKLFAKLVYKLKVIKGQVSHLGIFNLCNRLTGKKIL